MNNTIIGRKNQLADMKAVLSSNKPELLAVIGRRRVGKTFLIRETYGHLIDFELTGIQHATKKEQLKNFSFTFENYFPNHPLATEPTSWLEAFHFLSKALSTRSKKEKLVIFSDELPWLGTKRSGFIKGLSYFWNSWASKNNSSPRYLWLCSFMDD